MTGKFILWFEEIGKEDTPIVGGKCASLGEMNNKVNVPVLPGFAITADAYRHFIEYAGLKSFVRNTLSGLDTHNMRGLARRGKLIRKKISSAPMSPELKSAIFSAYKHLGEKLHHRNPYVAVRSSATAEDLPDASFAGQQETYLNVRGEKALIRNVKKCFASLFTNRAISYRVDKGFDHFKIGLSVGIQKMGRSDIGAAGVIFTLDPDTGFDKVVVINGSYGLGEYVVQGKVIPDEFVVFKPTMAIIEKKLGYKRVKLVRGKFRNVERRVSEHDINRFCLDTHHILELARHSIIIEKHYKKPMDIEWVLDGETNKLYIVQARPETVHSVSNKNMLKEYVLKDKGKVLLKGMAVGTRIGAGPANVLRSAKAINKFRKGDVLVTDMTDPDWEPIMKIASAIVTNKGGRTAHAAIVSRELGIPCVVGTGDATSVIRPGQKVTVDCSTGEGRVYSGVLRFHVLERDITKFPKTRTEIMVNVGEPDEVFSLAKLPVAGVGLAREEFIISSYIGAHPLHLIEIHEAEKYINTLAMGIGKIAAAFYPRPVIVRLSDFKTNEYASLKGGAKFEPKEENPMIGWRGASRYYDPGFVEAFELECKALKVVRNDMGLENVIVMVPFCRTVEEGKKVLAECERFGLSRKSGCKFYVMAEIPSNIILAHEFSKIFDGFSIGSNDLTQLTLGIDRDSEKLSKIFDERNAAVKILISDLIRKAHAHNPRRKVGICGQAPSDYPEFCEFLVKEGIDSISVNPDVAIKTIMLVGDVEKKLRRK
ncbi:MAG: phosphoenolpyruvate synthase [Candidatus Aenigmarchaeota archaeon]|nr:phosphoenolpyruvate synthase [Candidatus Aenigmarchaeota archaeon]